MAKLTLLRRFYSEKLLFGVLLLLGLGLRALIASNNTAMVQPDSPHYLRHATILLGTGGGVHELRYTPLYPMFLALFNYFGETRFTGMLIFVTQQLLGVATAFLYYLLARRVFNSVAALLVFGLCLLSPLALYYEAYLLTETLFGCLLALSFVSWERTLRSEKTVLWASATGLSFALLVLTRPVAKWLLLLVLLSLLIRVSRRSAKLKSCTFLLVSYCLIVGPWMLTNYKVHGLFGIAGGEGINLHLRVYDLEKFPAPTQTKHPQYRELVEEIRGKYHRSYFRVRNELIREGMTRLEADRKMLSFASEGLFENFSLYLMRLGPNLFKQIFNAENSINFCGGKLGPFFCHSRDSWRTLRTKQFPQQPITSFPTGRKLVYKYFELMSYPMTAFAILACLGALLAVRRGQHPMVYWLLLSGAYLAFVPAALIAPLDRFRLVFDPIIYLFCAYFCTTLFVRLRAANEPRITASPQPTKLQAVNS